MIRIKSKRHLFRRCGIPHPKEWTEYPDGGFSKKKLKILRAEPMLTVEHVKGRPDKDGDGLQDDVIEAAKAAIEAGDVTKDGRPEVKGIEAILGRGITAAERDIAWEKLQTTDGR